MTDTKQPEAMRLAACLQDHVVTYPQLSEDEPGGYCGEVDRVMDEAAAELRRLHAENTTLQQGYDAARLEIEARNKQLVKEAARTAEEKLRADRMTEQHRMQCQIRESLEREIEALREQREDASYESMNLAVMVLSDCGHSSNYKPLLERVAGRIDRHVERLLTAQQADRAMRAQAAPAVTDDTHAFQNFHRALCERFGYTHDARDWRRDQVSLIEHIAKLAAPAAVAGSMQLGGCPECGSRSCVARQCSLAHATSQMSPVAHGDALTPGDADQLEKVITDFEECGETDVPDETLQRFAAMGYLECVHYNVLPAAHEAIDAARAKAKEVASHG